MNMPLIYPLTTWHTIHDTTPWPHQHLGHYKCGWAFCPWLLLARSHWSGKYPHIRPHLKLRRSHDSSDHCLDVICNPLELSSFCHLVVLMLSSLPSCCPHGALVFRMSHYYASIVYTSRTSRYVHVFWDLPCRARPQLILSPQRLASSCEPVAICLFTHRCLLTVCLLCVLSCVVFSFHVFSRPVSPSLHLGAFAVSELQHPSLCWTLPSEQEDRLFPSPNFILHTHTCLFVHTQTLVLTFCHNFALY